MRSLSFGKMVWPHMLVRVMLAEQVYRAASILAEHTYHRLRICGWPKGRDEICLRLR
jgi:hypothetical protein